MDKRLDTQLMQFNERFQSVYFKPSKIKKLERYLLKLKRGDFLGICEDLKYRRDGIKYFSQKGNYIQSTCANQPLTGIKIAVYSCIVGKYDRIIEPINLESEIDYYIFTDLDIPAGSAWKKIDITQMPQYQELSPIQLNRLIKILPQIFLKEYDYSIYIDGNVEIVTGLASLISEMGNRGLGVHYHNTRDCIYDEKIAIAYYKKADISLVTTQLNEYRKDGFPSHYGLFENSILIRNHHDNTVLELMNAWWQEYLKYPTRDQISLPYLIWKLNFQSDNIYILGHNIDRNPRFNRLQKHI